MFKWKFTIRIDIYIINLRLENMFCSKMQSIKSLLQFSIQRNISIADEQKHILQMPAIDVFV